MDNLIYQPATRLANLIRTRVVSCEDVVTVHLDRIRQINPALNAVVALAPDALEQAEAADRALAAGESWGPLHGMPMTIKDSFDTAGVVTTWATPGRKDYVPADDATLVARLRAAGAILLGKTNTSEFTFSFDVTNAVYGSTNNPYDRERMSGGSSGGAAAIVAAGGAAFDIGSDTGGSIRLPAHFCGVAGLRPTSGRTPRTGHAVPFGTLADMLTTVGPLARTVSDLALLLPIIAGPDGKDPSVVPMPLGDYREVPLAGLRVAYFTDNGVVTPTPATTQSVVKAAEALADAGAVVEEKRPPDLDQTFTLLRGLANADGRAWLRRALARAGTGLEETSLRFIDNARSLSGEELALLFERWDRFRSAMLGFFQAHDLILCPVNARPAIPHDTLEAYLQGFTYTMTFNLTGWPAAVVRVGTSPEGLPIGVQAVAHPWREDVALAATDRLEKVFGGWQRPPI